MDWKNNASITIFMLPTLNSINSIMYQNKISNYIILFSQTITCLCRIPPKRTNTVFETASIETTTPKENDKFCYMKINFNSQYYLYRLS